MSAEVRFGRESDAEWNGYGERGGGIQKEDRFIAPDNGEVNFWLLELGDSRYKWTKAGGGARNTVEMESIRAYPLPGVTRSEF